MAELTDKELTELIAATRLINDKMTNADQFVEDTFDEMIRLQKPAGIESVDVTSKN